MNLNKKIRRSSIATLLVAVATPICLSAQQEPPVGQEPPSGTRPDPTRQEPRDPNKPARGVYDQDGRLTQAGDHTYASISKVVGAKVRMMPSAEEQREAARDNDAAKRPEGKIQDILVDHKTGECDYAVISFGGFIGIGDKTVAVPCEALKWNQSLERYDLDANEDRLKAMPTFDLSSARKNGLDVACATIDEQWKGTATKDDVGVRDAATGRGERGVGDGEKGERGTGVGERDHVGTIENTSFRVIPVKLAAATELDDHEIYTGATKFGKVNDLIVDRTTNKIALVVVTRGSTLGVGGKDYLLPWHAFRLCSSGEERVLCANVDASKLETAVVYEKPKHGVVDLDAARRALDFKGDNDGLRK